ncbi:MAG: DUF2520 domain-containing protein [Elusimicrobiales bacterium]|jgi:hypothetical protein
MNEIIIIGNSKAAINFSNYLKSIGVKNKIIPYRKTDSNKNAIKKAKTVFILTKDDNIQKFYRKYRKTIKDKKLFHFSGALTFKDITSLHPIYPFSKKPLTQKEFEKIIFTSENPKYIKSNLKWFKNEIVKINPCQKPYYHAVVSIYLNFPLLILRDLSRLIEKKFKIPKKYLRAVFFKNLKNFLKTEEVTGPIERKDKKTIKRHLKAIKKTRLLNLYEGMLKFTGR